LAYRIRYLGSLGGHWLQGFVILASTHRNIGFSRSCKLPPWGLPVLRHVPFFPGICFRYHVFRSLSNQTTSPDRGHRIRPDSCLDLSLDSRSCPYLDSCFCFCSCSYVSLCPCEVKTICPSCPCLLLAPCICYPSCLHSSNREVLYLGPVCYF
jgi:hypothetical protein